ncbi:MAG: hypothetical protein ABIA04_15690 [Pseudomonadota bacterium]
MNRNNLKAFIFLFALAYSSLIYSQSGDDALWALLGEVNQVLEQEPALRTAVIEAKDEFQRTSIDLESEVEEEFDVLLWNNLFNELATTGETFTFEDINTLYEEENSPETVQSPSDIYEFATSTVDNTSTDEAEPEGISYKEARNMIFKEYLDKVTNNDFRVKSFYWRFVLRLADFFNTSWNWTARNIYKENIGRVYSRDRQLLKVEAETLYLTKYLMKKHENMLFQDGSILLEAGLADFAEVWEMLLRDAGWDPSELTEMNLNNFESVYSDAISNPNIDIESEEQSNPDIICEEIKSIFLEKINNGEYDTALYIDLALEEDIRYFIDEIPEEYLLYETRNILLSDKVEPLIQEIMYELGY